MLLFVLTAIQWHVKDWYDSFAKFKINDLKIIYVIIWFAFLLHEIPIFFIYLHMQNTLLREAVRYLDSEQTHDICMIQEY